MIMMLIKSTAIAAARIQTGTAVAHRNRSFVVLVNCANKKHDGRIQEQLAFAKQLHAASGVLDANDKIKHLNALKASIKDVFPSYRETVDKIENESILEELSYICVMRKAPLQPYQCIVTRRVVSVMLENYDMTVDELTFLNHFLEYYGCI